MQPRISIIVPCYNGAEFLRETLDCLLKQTIEDWECIIVNDGSTDGSLEILKEYSAKDSRYKYIDKENAGPAVARNIGIAASCGKYILPLDSDDVISPSYLMKAIDYLELHPNCRVVYGVAEYFGDKSGIWELPDYSYETELWENAIYCTAVYRRSDFDKTSGYNPNMKYGNEDWDFWLSLLNYDDEVYKIPETVLFYRKHSLSHTTDLVSNKEKAYQQMILNHIDLYKPYLYKLFILKEHCGYLQKELDGVLNSRRYQIGEKLLSLFRFIK